MPISHLLEDFTARSDAETEARLVSADEWEDQRLAGFDEGYSAGWEDAVAAQARDHGRVSAALAQNLEDISFSYHEALAQMTVAMEPVFRVLIEKVLPQAMAQGFAGHIVEQIQQMARQQAAAPLILSVPPGAGEVLRPVLDRDLSVPINLHEDPDLQPDQARIRLGESEREIDGRHLIEMAANAVDSFLQQAKEETRHG